MGGNQSVTRLLTADTAGNGLADRLRAQVGRDLPVSEPHDHDERQAARSGATVASAPAVAGSSIRVQRDPGTTAVDDQTDVFPPPRVATWSTDRFEVSFARTGSPGNSEFEMTVRYVGPHTVFVSPVTRATVGIADRPLAVRVLDVDATGLTVDLYGDRARIVRLQDEAELSRLPGGPGRTHSFSAILDQQTRSISTLTIFDPEASAADLTAAPQPENPGANPVVEGVRMGADGWRVLLDGDGDQDKELQLTLSTAATTLTVTAVQRSSGATRTVTLPLPADGGSLLPLVREVTDGHAPTRIQLFASSPEPSLVLAPGTHGPNASTYRVSVGNGGADLVFPAETAPRRQIASAGAAQIAGGILATDVTLGAYQDTFRLSFRRMTDGRTTFGLSAVNDGTVRDTVGAELTLSGPIVYSVINTGSTSLGIDLNNDGVADLQIFDRLTTPQDYDGGGPPAQSRNHQIRVLGPAIGAERTFDFHYRYGGLQGVNPATGPAGAEAARNAEAVSSLAEQGRAGGLADTLDQIEIAMLSMRRRAVGRGLLAQALFDKNLALWQTLVRVRAQVAAGVPAPLQAQAAAAVAEYVAEIRNAETQPTTEQLVALTALTTAVQSANWPSVFSAYASAMAVSDATLRDRLERAGGEGDRDLREAKQLSDLSRELREIPPGSVIRVPATYHPDEQFRTEQGFVSMVPLQLYAWQDGSEWKLKDVTNPQQPFTYSLPMRVCTPLPPLALFNELDDPDHFPSGVINVQVPGGVAGRVSVRDRMTWKKFFTYLGLGLAAVGLTLAAVASAGVGAAAVPAAWALAGSALAGATAAGIDLAEHIQHDNLDTRTAVLDIAQIVAGLATAGTLAAGRIVIAAGAAPAASRWAGAWAQVAMLAQRAYVPMAVTAAAADVVTVAVISVDILRQLDEIDRGTASPEERTRAKMLLLVQAATMAGLTALQLKGIGPLGRGQTLVLAPGPDGVPVVSPALARGTLIIDTNIAIALQKRANNIPLQPGEQALLRRFDALGATDVRIADPTIAEVAAKGPAAQERGFAVGVDRTSAEYQALHAELVTANVGGGKGVVDRQIVADAFFGVGEAGTTPTLATGDPNVLKKLYAIKVAKENVKPLVQYGGKSLSEIFPDGFDVTINRRTLHVLPLPMR
ncbi:hypothetical protein KIPE111705_22095 [Kibdelosporangium persicum]|uniref:Uncharacterized protein n=1 Tax=Kibdelosporangium persicum TaxID=2698649 RepID=A0ABX2FF92_9PSEU|nr:hypothetical protein [Kibdelosporangium persicum]NRN69448.1 hypothetical protein [Kibdelosporangium persicum]